MATAQSVSLPNTSTFTGRTVGTPWLQTTETPFIYEPLPSEEHIRLLQVLPTPKGGSGKYFQLVTVALERGLRYETMSYVWGNPSRRHRLKFVDGTCLMITPSLSSILLLLVDHCETRYLWIDQVCIDQDSVSERNQQVKLMGNIYRCAARVLISLNPLNTFGVHRIGDGVNHILKLAEDPSQILFRDVILDGERAKVTNRRHVNDFSILDKQRWQAVAYLLRLAWFTRAWVFQEVMLSKSAIFVFYKLLVPFGFIVKLVQNMSVIEYELSNQSYLEPKSIATLPGFRSLAVMASTRKIVTATGVVPDILALLSDIVPHSVASESVDALFAFFGLMGDKGVKFEPNYQLSIEEKLVKFALAFIEGKGNLDILAFANRSGDTRGATWAPDWRRIKASIPLTVPSVQNQFDASSNLRH